MHTIYLETFTVHDAERRRMKEVDRMMQQREVQQVMLLPHLMRWRKTKCDDKHHQRTGTWRSLCDVYKKSTLKKTWWRHHTYYVSAGWRGWALSQAWVYNGRTIKTTMISHSERPMMISLPLYYGFVIHRSTLSKAGIKMNYPTLHSSFTLGHGYGIFRGHSPTLLWQ